MKYIIVVPDGMADHPIEELGNKTPLEAAHTTNMDYLAQNGIVGMVQTIPAKMHPGSDVGNLSLLGYDPAKCLTGRAPLEAANLDIELAADELAFRCNFVTIENGTMMDYSAGHISTQEATQLIGAINYEIRNADIRFYPGKSYRHIMVIKTRMLDEFMRIKSVPPHDIIGKSIKKFLPAGGAGRQLLRIMEQARHVLATHSVNNVRIDLKENPATDIWLWGQGPRPSIPSFEEKNRLRGGLISAVDLVNGIGRLAGLDTISVPGITGYYDTNYQGKADYAIKSLEDHDFVYIHIEGPDEAGHNGDYKAKMMCIENIDRIIIGTILNHFDQAEDFRLLVLPDHPTPIALRTHTREPVGFVMYGTGLTPDPAAHFSEVTASEKGLKFNNGEDLIEFFLKRHIG